MWLKAILVTPNLHLYRKVTWIHVWILCMWLLDSSHFTFHTLLLVMLGFPGDTFMTFFITLIYAIWLNMMDEEHDETLQIPYVRQTFHMLSFTHYSHVDPSHILNVLLCFYVIALCACFQLSYDYYLFFFTCKACFIFFTWSHITCIITCEKKNQQHMVMCTPVSFFWLCNSATIFF